VPIVDDLQQIATLLLRQRGEPPVVEDQKLDACEGLEHPGMTSIAACERQGIEQPRHSLIEDGAIVSAGLVTSAHASQLLPTPVGR